MTLTAIAGRLACTLTDATALAVSCFRPILAHVLTPDECEAAGLPDGSTERAVYCWPVKGSAWWRLDVWRDGPGCICVDAFGWHGEVHCQPRMEAGREATA